MSAESNDRRFCLQCGYDLRNLESHRCPECGRAFDPTKPSTYVNSPAVLGEWAFWLSLTTTVTLGVTALGHEFVPIEIVTSVSWFPPAWVIIWILSYNVSVGLAVFASFGVSGRWLRPNRTAYAVIALGGVVGLISLIMVWT